MDRDEILRVMDEMVEHQRAKVLRIARRLDPFLTPEDIRNPQDITVLKASHDFNFEDGILSGYLGARVALLYEMNHVTKPKEVKDSR